MKRIQCWYVSTGGSAEGECVFDEEKLFPFAVPQGRVSNSNPEFVALNDKLILYGINSSQSIIDEMEADVPTIKPVNAPKIEVGMVLESKKITGRLVIVRVGMRSARYRKLNTIKAIGVGVLELHMWEELGMSICAVPPEGFVHMLTQVFPPDICGCTMPKFNVYMRPRIAPADCIKVNDVEFWRKDRLEEVRMQFVASFNKKK